MILFSRLRSALGDVQRREWVLLGLETICILGGILIAFELNEWGTRRKEQARRLEVVERLFDEARQNVSELRIQRAHVDRMTERERTFATMLAQGKCPPADLWSAAYTVNMYPAIGVQTSVYQEMMGSGGLTTIADEGARKAVSDFYSNLDWVNSQIDYFRSHADHTFEIDDPRVTANFDWTQDEPLKLTFENEVLCADRKFRNRVADEVRDHQMVYFTTRELTEDAIRMCNRLGSMLKKACIPVEGGPLTGADAKVAALP